MGLSTMSVNQKIINAISPYCAVVAPDFYDGAAETYIVFNKYSDRAADHGDSRPVADVVFVHVHLFAPSNQNILDLIAQIRMALLMAGFSWPSVEHGADRDCQHIIFDTEIEDDEIMQLVNEKFNNERK